MRFSRICFLLFLLAGCQSPAIPLREAESTFDAKQGERAVVFTFLVRSVSVSRSQGIPWYTQLSEEDADELYHQFASELKEAGLAPAAPAQVLDLELVKSGRFQIREEFHINPKLLPIVKSPQDEEAMMRTARALGSDLYFVVLADHVVSRTMLRPAFIAAKFQITAFRASTGKPVFSALTEKSAQALPYDLPEADFQVKYREVMRKTALELLKDSLHEAAAALKTRMHLAPGEEKKPGPLNI